MILFLVLLIFITVKAIRPTHADDHYIVSKRIGDEFEDNAVGDDDYEIRLMRSEREAIEDGDPVNRRKFYNREQILESIRQARKRMMKSRNQGTLIGDHK